MVVNLLHHILLQKYRLTLHLRRLPTQNLVQFIDNYTTAIFLSHILPLDPHVVYCLHIYNTFAVPTTDNPRLFTDVVLFYHIF